MIPIAEAMQQAAAAHRAGDFGVAEQLYCQILAERDDLAEVAASMGTMYAQGKALGRAIVFLKYAHALNPKSVETMANLAIVYRMLDKPEQAIHWNMKALSLDPDNPITLSNLAGAYINGGTPVQAEAWAAAAMQKAPLLPEAQNHRALALLEQGKFEEGWKYYDGRFGVAQWHKRPYTCPQWQGERTRLLAVSGEQGLGDEIMFLTCLRQVMDMVDAVALEVAPRLVNLIRSSFPGVRVYATCEELLDECEPTAWTHMGSMPRQVWPVKPNTYLQPSGEYPKGAGKRIGLSWRGGTDQTHAKLRNFPIDRWARLLGFDAEYISLQYGPREKDAKQLGIPHDAASIADLDKLAAMIRSCDLVVTVCNTTVHMAGALGVPCIVLVPSKPAWRYGIAGEKMVWYDSIRMIRQGANEDWRSVVERVQQAIADYGFSENKVRQRKEQPEQVA